MTEDLKPADLELRCGAITLRDLQCQRKAVYEYEGRSYCGFHYLQVKELQNATLRTK